MADLDGIKVKIKHVKLDVLNFWDLLTSCCQDACSVSEYFAIFEDDVYFTVPQEF